MTELRNPTELRKKIAKLSPKQRAMLELKLRAKRQGRASAAISRGERETGSFPLSYAQQRLWTFYQLDPQNSAYNLSGAFRAAGEVRVPALQRALDKMVRRHSVLSTTFAVENGEPVQRVSAPEPADLRRIDLSDLPADEALRRTAQLANEDSRQPFDLESDPPFRFTLVRRADDHVFLVSLHHIIADGWSLDVFTRDLSTLYGALSLDKPSPLSELPCQYVDFVQWQQERLRDRFLEQSLDFWKRQLEDIPTVLPLPTDRPRPAVQTYVGQRVTHKLSESLGKALKALGLKEGKTLFMTLLAAFQVLLYRHTGQRKIAVGTPVANRDRVEIEDLIGLFVNMLVLVGEPAPELTFRQLLERVRRIVLDAHKQQHLPFDLLVDQLQPQRDPSYSPFFQVAYWLADQSQRQGTSGAGLNPLAVETVSSKFDLTLGINATGDRLGAEIEYNTDLFDRATITRMGGHLETLLEALTRAPDARLSELSLLDAVQRNQLLQQWNDDRTAYPRQSCVQHLFEARCELNPDDPALVFADHEYSYRELNERANRLAHHLRPLGVAAEVRVGVALERSAELIVAILGILKAGGTYLPLDADYPKQRLEYLIQDSRMPVVVTRRELSRNLPLDGIRTVVLDEEQKLIDRQSAENPVVDVAPENLAYVIYTSGSTGNPKGVSVDHRAIARLVCHTDYVEITPEDRIAHASNISFDAATFEIWGALLNGARLIGIPRDIMLQPAEFIELLRKQEISVLFLTTALFNQLIAHDPKAFETLRCVQFGGEAVDAQRVRQALEGGPPKELLHVYGPTENTTYSSWHRVRQVASDALTVPIGGPIANTQIYLLDHDLHPVPIGVLGELYLGGDGLARGYLHRPRLSAEKFVPSPLEESPGQRLYRSGDLVRHLPTGAIEFVGRVDHQVKVRGFRIEPGEIERVIREHPSVGDAAVVVQEQAEGRRLVAYFVAEPTGALTSDELRDALEGVLPAYMIPAVFVLMDELPLDPNGKIHRKALPPPEETAPDLAADLVAPRNPLEQQLAEIWAEILRVPRVGVRDNFFRLGGDSILSIRVAARAKELGLPLSARDLFEYPSIEGLAARAGSAQETFAEQEPIVGEVPLSPVQHWFFSYEPAEVHHWNMSIFLELRRPVVPELLERVVAHLRHHHDALRLSFHQGADGWRQRILSEPPSAGFCVCDLSIVRPDQRRVALESAAAHYQRSLDLARGDVVRVVYFDLGDEASARLLLIFHHLVFDGVSWRIVLDDLQVAYDQAEKGEPIQLPPKTTSLQAWNERLLEHAQSAEVRAELDDWLHPAPAEELPLDHPQGLASGQLMASARTVSVSLTPEETEAVIRDLPSRHATRINDVLLMALAASFAPWTGQRRLLLNLEGHGREPLFDGVDLSRTVGWFTTVFPVTVDLGDAATPVARLRRAQETLRRLPNRGVGFGLLRYLSEDEEVQRCLQASSVPRVSFNYLGQFEGVARSTEDESAPARYLPAPESQGPDTSPQAARQHLIDIVAQVSGGQLRFVWRYCENLHHRGTIEGLAERCLEELRSLIHHGSASSEAEASRPPKQKTQRSWPRWLRAPRRKKKRSQGSVLVPLQPKGQRAPFFCVHPTDGKLLWLNDLTESLGRDQPLYGLQSVVWSDVRHETPFHLEEMAKIYIDAIQEIQPNGPYLIGGVSFGGFVAFEMAQQLRRQGREVGLLAVIDAWSFTYQGKPALLALDPLETLMKAARNQARMHGGTLSLDSESLAGLSYDEQLDRVIEALAKTQLIPSRESLESIRRGLLTEMSHVHALASYRPKTYPGRITFFRAAGTSGLPLLEQHPARHEPDRGWAELSTEPIEIHQIAGEHQDMMFEPHVQVLARSLQTCLAQRSPHS